MRVNSLSRGVLLSLGLLVGSVVSAQTPPANGKAGSGAQGNGPVTTTTTVNQSSQSSNAPMGGRGFGEHVSGMAPEHPIDHGRHFGECVSEMAQGAECDHHMMH